MAFNVEPAMLSMLTGGLNLRSAAELCLNFAWVSSCRAKRQHDNRILPKCNSNMHAWLTAPTAFTQAWIPHRKTKGNGLHESAAPCACTLAVFLGVKQAPGTQPIIGVCRLYQSPRPVLLVDLDVAVAHVYGGVRPVQARIWAQGCRNAFPFPCSCAAHD